MNRLSILLFVLILFASACGPNTDPVEQGVANDPVEATEQPVEPATDIAASPTPEEMPPAATDEPVEATAAPEDEPTTVEDSSVEEPVAPTAVPTTEPESTPEEAVVFNGPYENTFFRGSAAAPVTLIDYSDFL